MSPDSAADLMQGPLAIAHLGLDDVINGARSSGVPVTQVEFQPPAGGDPKRLRKLSELYKPKIAKAIEQANQQALEKLLAGQPQLIGVGVARELIPDMQADLFLHAGPPIEWERMSGPLRGAVIGGILLEGLAKTPAQAEKLAAAGKVSFEPCHHHQCVGPMAGLVTSSMPVWIIEDKNSGRRSFCTLNEGLGKVLRYGAYSPEVIERLGFMADILAPILSETLQAHGPVDLKMLMAQ
ncbi:MAG: DUF1116 domain-containing protein, partial [Deltaproteobacteria bacterium]|nr:DUF1116 domain-containing protein [Deltaproteobacteria bacterium]